MIKKCGCITPHWPLHMTGRVASPNFKDVGTRLKMYVYRSTSRPTATARKDSTTTALTNRLYYIFPSEI